MSMTAVMAMQPSAIVAAAGLNEATPLRSA
jgi:hypothetical protein